MNNKIIIAIVCLLIVTCLAVGVGINLKDSNEEKKEISLSGTEIVSETETGIPESENSKNEEESETVSSTEKMISGNSVKATQVTRNSEQQVSTYPKTSTTKAQTTTGTTKSTASQKKTEKPMKAQFTVAFSINCEKATAYGADVPKYLISKSDCVVEEGTTVFDLMMEQCGKNGISVVHQNKSYVSSIGGLAEKDCGNSSGWIYTVNGIKPMMSASKYVLKDGDVVEWYYVTSPTD